MEEKRTRKCQREIWGDAKRRQKKNNSTQKLPLFASGCCSKKLIAAGGLTVAARSLQTHRQAEACTPPHWHRHSAGWERETAVDMK
jgi:hypothetical protein